MAVKLASPALQEVIDDLLAHYPRHLRQTNPLLDWHHEQVIINYLRKVYDNVGVSDRLEPVLYCLYRELLNKCLAHEPAMPAHTEPLQSAAKMAAPFASFGDAG